MSDDAYTLNLQQLAEMFPDMDREVVDMVLRDSAGALDPAVNILLNMNDKDYKPEEQEVEREKEIQSDAEYARRLAETEIAARHNSNSNMSRARSASAGVGSRQGRGTPTPTPPLQHPPNTSSSTSKIRSMLRFGRRSGSNVRQTPPPPPVNSSGGGAPFDTSAPSPPLQVRNGNAEALESDFSDASESIRDDFVEPAAVAVPREPDLIGLMDDSSPDILSTSYVPLSPSKPVAPVVKAQYDDYSDDGVIDMSNPFAVQFDPEDDDIHHHHSGGGRGALNDAPIVAGGDTNPFRARRLTGGATPPPS
ncbi:hypothetical protein GGI21_000797 [Coemansia aciculifera]|uniref:Uncharacterized protein n=1 Tax=Coemansia aciculifera TaxID=417176 RepID=A0ACC1M0C8_9FUNG|nr:hypothetical protein IWW38_003703 [Coemansia aciculifera]KAJ2910517.1 hypothetical protein GGI21_000797 [Coemansia aciculifera]